MSSERGPGLALAAAVAVALGLFAVGAWWLAGDRPVAVPPESPVEGTPLGDDFRADWAEMEAREGAILAITPRLASLGAAVRNLALPDARRRDVFDELVTVRDVAPGGAGAAESLPSVAARVERFAAEPEDRVATAADLALWAALFADLDRVDHASFAIVSGDYPEAGFRDSFDTEVAFGAAARDRGGRPVALSGHLSLRWGRGRGDGEAAAWRIRAWRTGDLTRNVAAGALFEEVLARALTDPEALARARRSLQEQHRIAAVRDPDGFEPPHEFFQLESIDRHPAVAVVDLDRDGFDDLYVMPTLGKNLFFHNRGDGSFEEMAEELGLALEDHSSAAAFADFDNDGDSDLFLGRSLLPSLYLANEGGRFVDRSAEAFDGPLPHFASAVSLADVDGDGLLDVYVSTYFSITRAPNRQGSPPGGLAIALRRYLPRGDADALERALAADDYHTYVNGPGPPNVLLLNAGGGRFRRSGDPAVELVRNSFQATFGDVDGDGDPDLYVASDFAPNNLLRNEGGGRFVDVTEATGTADVGFGMGAAFGDYDNDGRPDLYVSNMFSKAGRRILPSLSGLDPKLFATARGNSLFRNRGDHFEKVSGLAPPALTVEKAGWSWGGQFADLDNDGFLDLYALSGYYTAPPSVALERDT